MIGAWPDILTFLDRTGLGLRKHIKQDSKGFHPLVGGF